MCSKLLTRRFNHPLPMMKMKKNMRIVFMAETSIAGTEWIGIADGEGKRVLKNTRHIDSHIVLN
jgi:hypothetical protein